MALAEEMLQNETHELFKQILLFLTLFLDLLLHSLVDHGDHLSDWIHRQTHRRARRGNFSGHST